MLSVTSVSSVYLKGALNLVYFSPGNDIVGESTMFTPLKGWAKFMPTLRVSQETTPLLGNHIPGAERDISDASIVNNGIDSLGHRLVLS